VTDGRGKVTTFTNNVAGQPLTVTDPTNKTTTFEYSYGDATATIDPLGAKTRRFVDAAGRVRGVADPFANLVRTDYDLLNRPTKITDPLAGLTQFTYDANGNVLTLSDARSGVTTYTYDAMDRVATRKDPLLKTESYVYDANGDLTKVTDRLGLVTTYQYDGLNRQTFAGFKTQGTAPNFTYESTISYTYDAGNRLRTAVDSGAGTITLGYDDLDRRTSESSPQGSTSVGFDTAGRRISMTLTGQPQVTYGYDNADRLTSITQGTAVVGFTYDDAGRMLTSTLPNSLVGTYTYDAASHVTGISYAQGQTTVGALTYTYDAAGHRVTAGGSLARVTLPTAVSTTTYNADNQLTKWNSNQTKPTYDANGNMLTDGTYTYVWNARDQLIQLKQGTTVVGTFGYDALGRRISKTVTGTATGFVFDGGNFVQEKNGSGTPTANLLTGGTASRTWALTLPVREPPMSMKIRYVPVTGRVIAANVVPLPTPSQSRKSEPSGLKIRTLLLPTVTLLNSQLTTWLAAPANRMFEFWPGTVVVTVAAGPPIVAVVLGSGGTS
jgi:YD repeat-containing protein